MKVDLPANKVIQQEKGALRKKAEELCSVFMYEMLKHAGAEYGESSASKIYNSMLLQEHSASVINNPRLQEQLVDPIVKHWERTNE